MLSISFLNFSAWNVFLYLISTFLTEILSIFSSTYWTEMLYFLFPNLPNDKFFFLFKAFPTKMFILLSLNFSNWNAFYFFAKLFFRYQNAVEVFFPSPSFIPWLPLLGLGILSAASLRCLFPLSASSLSLSVCPAASSYSASLCCRTNLHANLSCLTCVCCTCVPILCHSSCGRPP